MRFDNNKRDYTDEIRRTNFHRWNFPPCLHFLDGLIYVIARRLLCREKGQQLAYYFGGCCRLSTVSAKNAWQALNRPCLHSILPKGLPRSETILFWGNGGFGVPEAAQPEAASFLFDKARRIAVNFAKLPVLMDRTKTEPQARRSGLF